MRVDVSNLTAFVLSFKYNEKVPRGISCRFLKLNEDWGIKAYHCPSERDNAFNRQKKCYGFGCAPRVGIKFDAGNDYFCYTTQVANAITEAVTGYDQRGYYEQNRMIREVYPDIDSMIAAVRRQSAENGYHMYDNHYGNWGMLEGKLVRIDFGDS